MENSELINRNVLLEKTFRKNGAIKLVGGVESGEWLEFDDYEPADINSLSHPQGLEYFCSDHYAWARELTGIAASSALLGALS